MSVKNIINDIISNPEISNNDKIIKTEEFLQKYNQTIYTSDGNYKPFTSVLDMLYDIWNDGLDV